MAWQDNVKHAISKEASSAWAAAGNRLGKRHKPYRISDLAEAMLVALNTDDEHEGKRLLLIWRKGALSLV
jgi:hypothetical protein